MGEQLPLYLGVHVMSDRVFTCSLDNFKGSFYRAFNSLFGKIGRIASEDVIVQLVKTKCLPVLYYNCLEACPLKKPQLSAVDLPSTALSGRFFPHALKKWLMGVNRYSAARHLPMQWQTENANF